MVVKTCILFTLEVEGEKTLHFLVNPCEVGSRVNNSSISQV